jgi:hypothetical protein
MHDDDILEMKYNRQDYIYNKRGLFIDKQKYEGWNCLSDTVVSELRPLMHSRTLRKGAPILTPQFTFLLTTYPQINKRERDSELILENPDHPILAGLRELVNFIYFLLLKVTNLLQYSS